jgi:hypothetical protein
MPRFVLAHLRTAGSVCLQAPVLPLWLTHAQLAFRTRMLRAPVLCRAATAAKHALQVQREGVSVIVLTMFGIVALVAVFLQSIFTTAVR